ncbi:GIY-YIG nuclease family protein [Lentimicrobium sp. L6]|nr:GIY-YIG nuclease family protein [Lentimicrobium sp. S6]NPD86961.1 GIY-YIG nuclease family protein [Lentimicrobium sp. L6]
MKFYFVYIITNLNKTVLYIGMSSDIKRRITEHSKGLIEGFSKKYHCKYLGHYEKYETPSEAISREKQIKKWNRKKKEALINENNPDWNFLNDMIFRVDDEYL